MRRDGGCVLGICALALGLGILIAAVFPVGALMFLVAFLLIACGIMCLKK
jgi:fucose permease